MTMDINTILQGVEQGEQLTDQELVFLLNSRTGQKRIIRVADHLNRSRHGGVVSYVHNRNLNFTNICVNRCGFCGFRRQAGEPDAFLLDTDQVLSNISQTPTVSEVCLQGGINPKFGLSRAMEMLRAINQAYPHIHIHAFSPMEIQHFAQSAGQPVQAVLEGLQAAGLGSIPGTAAEILVDEIRQIICPGKLNTKEWISIIKAAHRVGLRSTATIIAGHIERPEHVAAHFGILRRIQEETGGFTEFIPLVFMPHKTELAQKYNIKHMIDFNKIIRHYALARIYFNGSIDNIQSSWPKLGLDRAVACLAAGVNDLGGTLYSENITRSAGGSNGQWVDLTEFESAIMEQGKIPRQRDTLYNLDSCTG